MSRRRAHIAMVGVPIVSHVLPSLALIRELVARGHRVTYAKDPFVADRIESAGAELVPCTSTLPVAANDWPADPIAAASLFLDDAVQALPQLRAAYDDDPADCTSTTSAPPAPSPAAPVLLCPPEITHSAQRDAQRGETMTTAVTQRYMPAAGCKTS
jgi:UDP:flavonoid glycosyltransferase YjiC (YdhE family)